MKILRKIWHFLYKGGLCIFIFTIMFASAISLVSLTQKNKIFYGNRCNTIEDERIVDFLNQEEVISYDYEFNCNTSYIELILLDEITVENCKALLVRISSNLDAINYNINTQVTLKGNDYLIFASIEKSEVTMTISYI